YHHLCRAHLGSAGISRPGRRDYSQLGQLAVLGAASWRIRRWTLVVVYSPRRLYRYPGRRSFTHQFRHRRNCRPALAHRASRECRETQESCEARESCSVKVTHCFLYEDGETSMKATANPVAEPFALLPGLCYILLRA